MSVTPADKLKNIFVVGDRVLIKPRKHSEKTQSGLYLPPGVHEKEKVHTGYVMKVGPGYPIPVHMEEPEPWKEAEEAIRYIPLQAKEGDLAIFLQREAFEVMYENEKFFVVPQSSILMLERN